MRLHSIDSDGNVTIKFNYSLAINNVSLINLTVLDINVEVTDDQGDKSINKVSNWITESIKEHETPKEHSIVKI